MKEYFFILIAFCLGALVFSYGSEDTKLPQLSCPNPIMQNVQPTKELTFQPLESDFKFSYFWLGNTKQEIQNTCENAGGKLFEKGKPNDEAGLPWTVCFFQDGDGVTDGYYPVYWPWLATN